MGRDVRGNTEDDFEDHCPLLIPPNWHEQDRSDCWYELPERSIGRATAVATVEIVGLDWTTITAFIFVGIESSNGSLIAMGAGKGRSEVVCLLKEPPGVTTKLIFPFSRLRQCYHYPRTF